MTLTKTLLQSLAKSLIALLLSASLLAGYVQAADGESETVASKLQQLKREVIKLNRDLFVLEEDLLFPSSTQLAVYLSMDVGAFFQLDAVELRVNNQPVTHYLYTDKQVKALHRGGVQKLYVGNIGQGEHEITAVFTGLGPQQRPYKRATSFTFDKTADAKGLELRIEDKTAPQQPQFSVVEL